MPADLPITLDTLQTVAAIVVGAVTVGFTVGAAVLKAGASLRDALTKQIDAVRNESADGRKRVHERLDRLEEHIDTTYVRADVYAADQRTTLHAVEETQRLLETVVAARRAPEPATR